MSRPIEFRAWHRKMKQYCYTHGNPHRRLEFICGRWIAEFDRGMADFVPDYDVEVEQYTGLNDKNGTKAFDGDVFLINGVKWAVEWDEEDGSWALSRLDHKMSAHDFYDARNHEIVGAIHDRGEA